MSKTGVGSNESGQLFARGVNAPTLASLADDAWSFVYIFFTNGIPFDAPNRSEPCPCF